MNCLNVARQRLGPDSDVRSVRTLAGVCGRSVRLQPDALVAASSFTRNNSATAIAPGTIVSANSVR